MKSFEICLFFVLVLYGLLIVQGNCHDVSEARIFCRKERGDDPSSCIAGSYESKCKRTKCYRVPGELCRTVNADLYGGKCHEDSFCGCEGRCIGYVKVSGKEFEHNDENCMAFQKRSRARLPLRNYEDDNMNYYRLMDPTIF